MRAPSEPAYADSESGETEVLELRPTRSESVEQLAFWLVFFAISLAMLLIMRGPLSWIPASIGVVFFGLMTTLAAIDWMSPASLTRIDWSGISIDRYGRWEFHPWENFEDFSLWRSRRASGVEGVLLLGAAAARAAPGVDAQAVRRVIIPDLGPYRKEQLLAILRERHQLAARRT